MPTRAATSMTRHIRAASARFARARSRAFLAALVTGLVTQLPMGAQVPAVRAAVPAWNVPLTSWGEPDLEGVWLNNAATPLERPEPLTGRTRLSDDEVALLQRRADALFDEGKSDAALGDAVFLAAFANLETFKNPDATGTSRETLHREFDNRTSLIVDPLDGRIPPLTLSGQQRQAAIAAARQRPTGPEDLSGALRCITWGVPRFAAGNPYSSHYRILQSPGYVVVHMESDVRIIPVGPRPPLAPTIRQWNGDSRGRWEGRTLVVETSNLSSQSFFRGAAENLTFVERFTRTAADRLEYQITIDDSTTWTRPWTVLIELKMTKDNLFEFACHEGNYEVMRGILGAARKTP